MSEPRNIAAEKDELRARMRALRRTIDLEVMLDSAQALSRNLLSLPGVAAARTVLTYRAMPEEVDPGVAIEELRSRGALVAYPRIVSPGVVELHSVEDVGSLLLGPFGLAEPSPGAPVVDPSRIDAAIIPGIAFDGAGRRLGYGGGYFDGLIPRLGRGCLKVGVAFDVQLVDKVPTTEQDRGVDVIVTPTQLIRVRG